MRAFTFVEFTITLSIALGFVALAMPIFSESRRDALFLAFASEITAELATARHFAQLSGRSVVLDFQEDSPFLFRITCGEILISSRKKHSRYSGSLPQLILPGNTLDHPTTGNQLTRALSSSHGRRIVFAQRGSSSATLVFSLEEKRTLCLVISGSTGRFRAYIRKGHHWVPFQ